MEPQKPVQTLQEKILSIVPIFIQLLRDEASDSSEIDSEQFNELFESILEYLVWEPGTLLYFEDPDDIPRAKFVTELIWKNADNERIFEEMTEGGYSGLLVNMVGDYLDRAKMLKPTFTSIYPEHSEFHVYYREAMRCWLFGMSNAAVILSNSLIELILYDRLSEISQELVVNLDYRNGNPCVSKHKLKELIDNAKNEDLISYEETQAAHEIRKLRNRAVHEQRVISDKESFKVIEDTKIIAEKLGSIQGKGFKY